MYLYIDYFYITLIYKIIQIMVRFFEDYRIKKHNPLPTAVTVYCLGFWFCNYTLLAEYLVFTYILFSTHRLLHKLLGYLILFATSAFIPQCQLTFLIISSRLSVLSFSKHFISLYDISLIIPFNSILLF